MIGLSCGEVLPCYRSVGSMPYALNFTKFWDFQTVGQVFWKSQIVWTNSVPHPRKFVPPPAQGTGIIIKNKIKKYSRNFELLPILLYAKK